MPIKRLAAFVGTGLGFAGTIGCAAAMIVVVWVGLRMIRANNRLFGLVDRSLADARESVLAAQHRVQETTAEDIASAARDWTRQEVAQELAARVNASAEKWTRRIEQAQGWVERSSAAMKAIRQTLDVAGEAGLPADGTVLAAASDALDDLPGRFQQAIETIQGLRQRVAKLAEDPAARDRAASLMQMTGGVNVILRRIDARLGEVAERLGERRAKAEQRRIGIRRSLVIADAVVLLGVAWMAAGQVALCACGWKSGRAAARYSAAEAS